MEGSVNVLDLRTDHVICPFGYQNAHREVVLSALSPEPGLWKVATCDRDGNNREYVWAIDDVTDVAFIADLPPGDL